MAGSLHYRTGDQDSIVGRLLASGTPDSSFGLGGVRVARLWSDGTLDASFGPGHAGTMTFAFNHGGADADTGTAMVLAPDGRVVVAGSAEYGGFHTDFAGVRLDNDLIFADGFEQEDTGP